MQTWHHVLRKSHSASMKSNTCEDEARFTVQVGFERERPSHRFCASLAQDPLAQRDDEADLLGQWNEVGRQNHAALGMMPMQQGLEATDVATLQIDHRLIVEFELVLAEGFPEFELECAAQLDAPIHFWFEKVKAPAAIRLGTVQCHVCVAQ